MPIHGFCSVCKGETVDYLCPYCLNRRVAQLENIIRNREQATRPTTKVDPTVDLADDDTPIPDR